MADHPAALTTGTALAMGTELATEDTETALPAASPESLAAAADPAPAANLASLEVEDIHLVTDTLLKDTEATDTPTAAMETTADTETTVRPPASLASPAVDMDLPQAANRASPADTDLTRAHRATMATAMAATEATAMADTTAVLQARAESLARAAEGERKSSRLPLLLLGTCVLPPGYRPSRERALKTQVALLKI